MKLALLGALLLVIVAASQGDSGSGSGDVLDVPVDENELIGTKFTRKELKKYLAGKPKLWEAHPVSRTKKHKHRRRLGASRPSKKDKEHRARARKRHSKKHSKNRKLRFRDFNSLPKNFDAREKWPNCTSIRIIQDQANCGSCWAVATASALSDRICIATNGGRQPQLSAAHLMSCCSECQATPGNGCDGGDSRQAAEFFQKNGIITGGVYDSNLGCRPYTISSFENGNDNPPQCTDKCEDGENFESTKHYGSDIVYPSTVGEMQQEIYNNGPIVTHLIIHEDFYSYKSGIYYRKTGTDQGGHLVKLIGWGEDESGTPYWLIANSWGSDWGEDGTFRIVRGTNHVEIEGFPVGATYDYARSASS